MIPFLKSNDAKTRILILLEKCWRSVLCRPLLLNKACSNGGFEKKVRKSEGFLTIIHIYAKVSQYNVAT